MLACTFLDYTLVVYNRLGKQQRRDGRADEGGGLENRYTGDCIVGSNPTPSAIVRLVNVRLTLC